MRVAIHQPNVLPHLGLFVKLALADVFIVLDDVQLDVDGYTRRVRIAGPAAEAEWLTLPFHRAPDLKIADVVLKSRRAFDDAWDTLHDRYATMKWWPALSPILHRISLTAQNDGGRLMRVNIAGIGGLAGLLGLKPPRMILASSLRKTALPKDEGNLQLCKAVGATTYIAGPGSAVYANVGRWKGEGVTYRPLKWEPPDYEGRQEAGMSSVDALCRMGPEWCHRMLNETSGLIL